MSAAAFRLIAVGCRELGIDDDARREMLRARYGVESRKDLSPDQLSDLIEHLKASGFRPTRAGQAGQGGQAQGARKRPMSQHGYIRKLWALWGNLKRAGVLDATDTDAALVAFVNRHRKTGHMDRIEQLEWMTEAEASPIIEALKAWCRREGLRS
jgi:hypothetical protein